MQTTEKWLLLHIEPITLSKTMKSIVKTAVACSIMALAMTAGAATKSYTLTSPQSKTTVTVTIADTLGYSVIHNGEPVVESAKIALVTDMNAIGLRPKVKNVRRGSVSETLRPVVAFKKSEIPNDYNWLTVNLADGNAIEFRAFDNAVAHRFVTRIGKADSINVNNEIFLFRLRPGATVHVQHPDSFVTPYQEPYAHLSMDKWTAKKKVSTLPVLASHPSGDLTLISESNLADYPSMFLSGNGVNEIEAVFPKVVKKWRMDGDRKMNIQEEYPYIARTAASREFPWRFMTFGKATDIVEQTVVAQLAGDCRLESTDWIKPGQAAWEWWSGAVPYGDDVDFEAGVNTPTYKYYIDFASANSIPYIVIDAGWAVDSRNPYEVNPDVDIKEIIGYGNAKNVGVFLWMPWYAVYLHPDVFERLSKMGVKGMKVDFLYRNDQWMVNFYEKMCQEAARNNMLLDIHGSFKPAGLEYRYPNLLTYEGVRGMELNGKCQPDNTLYIPFMRNAVGPLDYTPGAMISMQPDVYAAKRPNSGSVGTRAYQMALFVVLESGLQMLADNPTNYGRFPDCTRFITSVPVSWDETRALQAVAGQYLIEAKRKGSDWFVAAICNGDEKWREFELPLDFLPEGATFEAECFEDGINAPRQAMDYRHKKTTLTRKNILKLRLARNGGWAARLTPAK